MNEPLDIDAELFEYALDEMGEEDRRRFEERLAKDLDLREEVAGARSVLTALHALPSEGWEDPPDPALILPPDAPGEGAVGGEAGADRRELPGGRPSATESTQNVERRSGGVTRIRDLFGSMPLGALAGAAAAILGVGLIVGLLIGGAGGGTSTGSGETVVSTTQLDPFGAGDPPAAGVAEIREDGEGDLNLAVDVEGLPASQSGNYYELWLIRGENLLSLGGFKVGQNGSRTVQVPLPVDPGSESLIDLSLEEDDGDPTHSTISLLRGSA